MLFWDLYVTKSKLVLLTAQQANKSKDKLLGLETATSFRKPSTWDDSGTRVPKNHHPKEESRLLLYTRGSSVVGCYRLLGSNVLYSVSCPHRSGHSVLINLQQRQMLFFSPATFYLYMNGSVIPLMVRALRMETKVFSYPKTCNKFIWMLVPCYVWLGGILLL